MNWVWVRFGPPLVALRGVAGNRALRRTSIAFLIFSGAEAATWVAILVFAYERGGASATGLVGLLLLLPAGVLAPIGAALGDRYRRERVLGFGYLAQAIATGLTAVAIALDAPDAAVYAGAVVAMVTMTTSRPAHHSLMPTLAQTPDEVTARELGLLARRWARQHARHAVGHRAAGRRHGGHGVRGGGRDAGVRRARGPDARGRTPRRHRRDALRPWGLVIEAGHAFAVIARSPGPRLLVGLAALMTVAWGAFDVLLVSVAIDVLGLGDSGVGALQTAAGLGALAGAAGSVALVGRRGLWPAIVGATIVLAAGFVLAGSTRGVALVVAATLAAGGALTVLDVVGRTLLQRVVDDAILTRVFGVIEALWMAGVGVGSGIAGVLTRTFSIPTALAIVGGGLVVLTVPTIPGLRRIDHAAVVPERQFSLVRGLAMFAPLPRTELERVARQLTRIVTPTGADVVVQGETGDRFYVIDAGAFDVIVDGDADPPSERGRLLRRDRAAARCAPHGDRARGRGRRGVGPGSGGVPGHRDRSAAGRTRGARDQRRATARPGAAGRAGA